MTDPKANAPLSELIGSLVADVSGLLRKEIDLAKTEASEKVSTALGGIEVAGEGPATGKPDNDQKYEVDCEPANDSVHDVS